MTAGLRQADVIDRSVHRLPLYEKMKTVKIETSNLNVQQTARQILHLLNKNKCGGLLAVNNTISIKKKKLSGGKAG